MTRVYTLALKSDMQPDPLLYWLLLSFCSMPLSPELSPASGPLFRRLPVQAIAKMRCTDEYAVTEQTSIEEQVHVSNWTWGWA